MNENIKFIDPTKGAVVSLSNTSKNLGAVIDLKGHEMFSNSTNYYIWGKAPSGGGSAFYVKHEEISYDDLTQKGIRFVPTMDISLKLKIEINCYCKSKMNIAIGMIDISSQTYSEFGRAEINGFTRAQINSKLHLTKGKDFIVILWQVELGDSIRVLDYFEGEPTKWFNQITFG